MFSNCQPVKTGSNSLAVKFIQGGHQVAAYLVVEVLVEEVWFLLLLVATTLVVVTISLSVPALALSIVSPATLAPVVVVILSPALIAL